MKTTLQSLRDAIREHPVRSLGYAAAAGACVAARRSKDPLIRNAARAAITIMVALLREVAVDGALQRARSWIDRGDRIADADIIASRARPA